MSSFCDASTTDTPYGRTVICELEHGHTGPHHGHVNEGPQFGSYHYSGPFSWDWAEVEIESPYQ